VTYESAKQLLAEATTYPDRSRALSAALAAGMPLSEIEEYLDWLDAHRAAAPPTDAPSRSA